MPATFLALAFQLAAAAPVPSSPSVIVVRDGTKATAVPVARGGGEPMVQGSLLARALGGRLSPATGGRWTLTVGTASLTLRDGLPFARGERGVEALLGAPRAERGELWVPLQLASDVVPRAVTGFFYDARAGELRRFGAVASAAPAPRREAPASRVPERARPSARRDDTPATRPTSLATPRRGRLVVVDAGHGGPDRGMSGPVGAAEKIYEKDITLQVATKLAAELRERGVEVLMTRTTDTLIALSDRGRIANAAKGDLFISIHVNAANPNWKNPGAARGFETYFLAEAKTEDAARVARMENEAVRFETNATVSDGDPLSFIIHDMAQNEHLRESSDLAATVQRAMRSIHPGPNRGVKQAGFRVLVTAYMPAILVEIGFGTNPAEARWMSDPARQRELARTIAEATIEYLGHYERRVGAGAPGS